ncbi:shikimate kinase [Actinotalea sp. M2MS4P-6]|uniref:shikimate kinase n=1 Tax=Actinotalea sp. M2MS4P-6 TaxID=2983762 RepID=UPI0021E50F01|nr:shikimate kinase [Actinotalea sp. M2MS4P-6]MCV2396364.1 shikimate kinase [Actinotalea sp. M2MS4P-6]
MTRPSGPEQGPLAVLCGPMGSGKSAVGGTLARRWGVRLRDTDHDVEAAAGCTIREVFAEHGEEGFRDLEHQALVRALAGHDGVLALGGGAVLRADSRAALAEYVARGGHVVFLDVDVDHAMERVGRDRSRPLLAEDPRARWSALMAERRPVYLEVATDRVRTGGRSLGQVAAEIERRLLRSER